MEGCITGRNPRKTKIYNFMASNANEGNDENSKIPHKVFIYHESHVVLFAKISSCETLASIKVGKPYSSSCNRRFFRKNCICKYLSRRNNGYLLFYPLENTVHV